MLLLNSIETKIVYQISAQKKKKSTALLFFSGKALWVSLITNRFICFLPSEAAEFARPTLGWICVTVALRKE